MKKQQWITINVALFALLWVASFSFPFQILPDIGAVLESIYGGLYDRFVSNEASLRYHSGEDSVGMLVNTIAIFSLSQFIFWVLYLKMASKREVFFTYSVTFLRYYLALILLIYGFDKIYKWQFYYPEPNVLHTQLKELPQDLLYWSTMGTSYSYSLFGGFMEVLPGVLLLFRRTTVIGGFIAFAVLLNVFLVNIGFDITVKLFSGMLLLFACVLVLPNALNILGFFMMKPKNLSEIPSITLPYKKYFKLGVLLLFLIETQFKYVSSGNFNDDLSNRPLMHGSYELISPESNTITRIHFHRQGYLILEDQESNFYDYKIELNESDTSLIVRDYTGNQFFLKGTILGDTLVLEGNFNRQWMSWVAVKTYTYLP